MKFKQKIIKEFEKDGKYFRVIEQFIFWPLPLKQETRWLETAKILQQWAGFSLGKAGWYNIDWWNED